MIPHLHHRSEAKVNMSTNITPQQAPLVSILKPKDGYSSSTKPDKPEVPQILSI